MCVCVWECVSIIRLKQRGVIVLCVGVYRARLNTQRRYVTPLGRLSLSVSSDAPGTFSTECLRQNTLTHQRTHTHSCLAGLKCICVTYTHKLCQYHNVRHGRLLLFLCAGLCFDVHVFSCLQNL